jgi:hypothetical protein
MQERNHQILFLSLFTKILLCNKVVLENIVNNQAKEFSSIVFNFTRACTLILLQQIMKELKIKLCSFDGNVVEKVLIFSVLISIEDVVQIC